MTKNETIMKLMKRLPTNKHGEVYYGPKTVAEAEAAIRDMDAHPEKVVADLRRAGYWRVAAILAKAYRVDWCDNCGRADYER